MVFETVYKVPKGILKGENGFRYLKKGDLECLTEYQLLFFKRNLNFHILDDFPCLGAWERRLRHSEITGPYETAPDIKNIDIYSESQEDLVEFIVPLSIIPVKFENVSLFEYGTETKESSQDHFNNFRKGVNPGKMLEIGHNSLEILHKMNVGLEQIAESTYRGLAMDCIFDLTVQDVKGSYIYPDVSISAFGRDNKPRELIQQLGLYELENQFPGYDVDIGINKSIERGLGYNLSLDGLSIPKVNKSEKIVL